MQENIVFLSSYNSLAPMQAAGSRKRKQPHLRWEIEMRRVGELIREGTKELKMWHCRCRAEI